MKYLIVRYIFIINGILMSNVSFAQNLFETLNTEKLESALLCIEYESNLYLFSQTTIEQTENIKKQIIIIHKINNSNEVFILDTLTLLDSSLTISNAFIKGGIMTIYASASSNITDSYITYPNLIKFEKDLSNELWNHHTVISLSQNNTVGKIKKIPLSNTTDLLVLSVDSSTDIWQRSRNLKIVFLKIDILNQNIIETHIYYPAPNRINGFDFWMNNQYNIMGVINYDLPFASAFYNLDSNLKLIEIKRYSYFDDYKTAPLYGKISGLSDTNGNVVLLTTSDSLNLSLRESYHRIVLLKLDGSLNLISKKNYIDDKVGYKNPDIRYGIPSYGEVIEPKNNISYVTGYTFGSNNLCVVKQVDSNFKSIWSKRLSVDSSSLIINNSIASSDAGCWIIGTLENNYTGDQNIFVTKLSKNGLVSSLVNLNLRQSKLGFKIFPNPSNNFFSIFLNTENKTDKYYQVVIKDIQGKEVYSNNTETLENINISELKTGLYFVSLYSKSVCGTLKFIKE